MDNIKQVGKRFREIERETEHNIRRIAENFPMIERKSESINPIQSHRLEFTTSNHPHSIKLNVYFSEPEKDCHPQPLDVIATAYAACPNFPFGTGVGVFPGGGFFSQVGGFTLTTAGVVVPVSGYYELHFTNAVGGVNVDGGSFIMYQITVGGGVVAQQINSAGHGYNPPLSGLNSLFDLYAVSYIAAGTVVGVVLQAAGIAFLTPSNLCGFLGDQGLTLTLVGAA